MAIIPFLIVASIICWIAIHRNNIKILNHFRDSFQEKETQRLLLVSDLTSRIDKLESDVAIEMLLLKAEGQFVKATLTNMLNAIKAKSTDLYNMTHKDLQSIAIEVSDLENNLFKKSKQ